MASSPEEYQQWRLSCTQQLHDDDNHDKWKRPRDIVATPQTQNSTFNTSEESNNGSMMLDDGYRQQLQQQQQQSSYWTPQEERSFRLDCLSLETTPLTCNRPKQQTTITSSPTDICSPVAAVHVEAMSPSLPPFDRVVMRDATNTSTEVESRALFPDDSDEDNDYHRNNNDDKALVHKPHHRRQQTVGDHHDLKKEQTAAASSTTFASAMKNGPQSSRGIMKSRRKNSPDHHHHHLLADVVAPSWKVSNQMPLVSPPGYRLDQQQHHHHRGIVHPLLYHERNPSVDSSLSTLSSLDGTCDGSAQTSPHPYRPSSVLLVVSARNSVLRRISTLATMTDSHSLPPPRYRNNNNHDLNHPATTTTFGDAAAAADGTVLLSSSSRGGARTGSAKSLLRLAATNNGLLWIMCFMALSSASMTVLTSRMLKSHEKPITHLEKPGSGSILFPPTGIKKRVLIPVNQHMQQQQHDGKSTLALRQASVTTTVVEKGKTSHDLVEDKQGKPKQQPVQIVVVNQKEATTTKRRHTREKRSAATSKGTNDKHTIQQHKNEVDAKAKSTQIQSAFNLKPVQLPKGTIAEMRKEVIDHKLYRTRSFKGMVQEHQRRIIYMHESLVHQKPKPRKLVQYPADFTDSTQLYSVLDSGDERVSKSMELREPYVQGECVPMQGWQTTFYPSCNHVHALSLDRLGDEADSSDGFELFGTKGFWRNAWKVQVKSTGQDRSKNIGTDEDVIVLKTLKIQHQFEDAHFEHNRIDAVAMERLTSSPHVINMFGFCGHSVMTEYADGNRLGALADKSRSTPLARLRIARDIATGLADVHGIDGDGNTTFVHLDVNPANIVSIGGTLKLNDFNIGIIRRWNTTSNEPCGFPAQYPNPQWRSPEEARNELNLTEKVDVFSMGHIFFRLICGHEPWNKLEPGGKPSKTEMNEKVKQGILPTIPASVLQSTDKEVVAIREAMFQCYKFNPKARPTARNIASALQGALDKLERK